MAKLRVSSVMWHYRVIYTPHRAAHTKVEQIKSNHVVVRDFSAFPEV